MHLAGSELQTQLYFGGGGWSFISCPCCAKDLSHGRCLHGPGQHGCGRWELGPGGPQPNPGWTMATRDCVLAMDRCLNFLLFLFFLYCRTPKGAAWDEAAGEERLQLRGSITALPDGCDCGGRWVFSPSMLGCCPLHPPRMCRLKKKQIIPAFLAFSATSAIPGLIPLCSQEMPQMQFEV